MNKLVIGLIGGVAGAVAATLTHELVRHFYDGAPRLDKLGEQAVDKVVKATVGESFSKKELYPVSMAADVLSNAWYYSAAATCPYPITAGATLGLVAGLGAVKLPATIGLSAQHTGATTERRWITVGLYTLGGIVAGSVIRALRNNSDA